MNRLHTTALLSALLLSSAAFAKDEPSFFKPEQSETQGSVNGVDYQAVAGTLVVHAAGWEDTDPLEKEKDKADSGSASEASMFYAAYFKKNTRAENRPITFLFNGGPGSSTIWLHMGSFGPKRVVTPGDQHQPAAPYKLIDNQFSLLDVSDLVFIDAPGTGFSRIAGKDKEKEKAFYGVDQDAHAFAEFITAFLGKYGRWNSPKYIFGESYGTTRAGALVNLLENDYAVDVNGVILVSQALNYDVLPDYPTLNPGVDEPYVMWLPSYATTAWYHKRLPDDAPKDLKALVAEVTAFAGGEYTSALASGNLLDPAKRKAVVEKLHRYTGLPAAYIEKADLRVTMGEFQKTLLGDEDATTGGLDTRFSGPTIDPLSKEASYDPQGAAIGSAYVAVGNEYLRKVLKFGGERVYKPDIPVESDWDFSHRPPGAGKPLKTQVNVMPDLAAAMKANPHLKVMANAGYFDVVTPFYEGIYEMAHLAIPPSLRGNIEFAYYQSGHMVYVNEAELKPLHDNIAAFIKKTANAQ